MKKLLQFFDNQILKISAILVTLFISWYPKLPSVHINHTWVYIRLEDFAIAALVLLWLVQLLRKKVRLVIAEGIPLALYWIIGGLSLAYCFVFIAPHLANFFPKVAVLEYLRRIEYMILFFVGFSTIKTVKDIRDYMIGLGVTLIGVVLYGLGQHFYLTIWGLFPSFFEKYSFCFPSFQTGNEQFAKGLALCLPGDARVTSTFGGSYDLSAYLVVFLPVLFAYLLTLRRKLWQVLVSILFVGGVMTLIFTSSRVSFVAYLIGVSIAIIMTNRKKLLIPVFVGSIVLLVLFSGSTAKRFLDTIRLTSVVTNSQGQVIGVAPQSLPTDLQNKISKSSIVVGNVPTQSLPTGSSFITLPQSAPIATNVAVVKSNISAKEAERLKLANGGLQLSTVSGSFLIQKALVYDISFTTRLQGEWPRDWAAFLSSPAFGTGYSSLTLASDNDYLRALGETGALGLLSFLGIFLIFGIYAKHFLQHAEDKTGRFFAIGLIGGVIGLFLNAALIDVFEASKVAEPLWLFLGVGMGAMALSQPKKIPYKKDLRSFFTSHIMLGIGLLIVTFSAFLGMINNFFVADDFVWLKWAASSTFSDIPKYFVNAQDFFYRPLDKTMMLLLYTVFSFQPQGYHIFTIVVHFLVAIGVYIFLLQLFGRKLWAFIGSLLFILLPSHAENLYWVATISTNLATLFMLYGAILYEAAQKRSKILLIPVSIIFAALALTSYEMAVVLPFLLVALDLLQKRSFKKQWLLYIPFVLLDGVYVVVRALSHTVAAGGDYAYSLSHLIPNVVGNFFGYLLLFLFGPSSLAFYEALRTNAKAYVLPVTIIILAVFVVGLVIFLKKKSWVVKQTEHLRLFLFGLIFAFISLMPFLGLGNITERYLYLASIGFIIAVLVILRALLVYGLKKSIRAGVAIGLAVLIVVILWSGSILQKENADWAHAGKITYSTLGYFKIEQDSLPHGSTLYVVNRPIRYADAWVFPVGMPEGLWFVYRDTSQVVNYAPTVAEAKAMAGEKGYIFTFDQKGNISKVQ